MGRLCRSLAFIIACFLLMGTTGSGQETIVGYSNVKVVSLDPVERLVVIRKASGAQETLLLDDTIGLGGIKAGDHVMMAVRDEPGRKRISAMTKVTAKAAPAQAGPAAAARPIVPAIEGLQAGPRARFADQVVAASREALPVDGLWSQFETACDANPPAAAEDSREWFGLWDGRVTADLSSGFCRDLFNQIVDGGEGVKRRMATAEEAVRRTLTPGDLRAIRRASGMDWDGWTLPAPKKLKP